MFKSKLAKTGPGNETASTPLDLIVERYNTAPRLLEGPVVVHMGDDRITDRYMRCPSPVACTAFGTPKLEVLGCDAEGDRITFEVEVVRRGQPFSGEPNYAAPSNDRCTCSQDPVCYLWISLPGLELEQSYDFAVRLTDEFGATAGWVRRRGILSTRGPARRDSARAWSRNGSVLRITSAAVVTASCRVYPQELANKARYLQLHEAPARRPKRRMKSGNGVEVVESHSASEAIAPRPSVLKPNS
jgi:hypothetical protein